MSGCSRAAKTNLSKKLLKQVNAQLKAVVQLYPGTTFVALVGPRQELIDYESTKSAFELKKERERLESMLGIVASLRHAALDVGTLLKQRNVQPIVTVRGSSHSFVCYPVGDDKLLLFYIDAPFDTPLRVESTSTPSTTASTATATSEDGPLRDDEIEADEMTHICTDLQQLLVGVKFER